MSKRNYSIIEEMRGALMDTYRKVAPDCWSQQEAWEKTVRHPAPRYYITAKQAYQRLLSKRADCYRLPDGAPQEQHLAR